MTGARHSDSLVARCGWWVEAAIVTAALAFSAFAWGMLLGAIAERILR